MKNKEEKQQKKHIKRKGKQKTPPQLLKETRERHIVKELVKNPNATAERLGEILGCDKSTITRLKAWKHKRVLAHSPPLSKDKH